MRKTRLSLLSLAVVVLCVTRASALPIPVWLTLTPDSELTVSVSALDGAVTDSATVPVEGTIHTLMEWIDDSAVGPFTNMLGIEALDLFPGNFELALDLEQFGSAEAAAFDLHVSGSGPLVPFGFVSGGPGLTPTAEFDLDGTTFAIDDGILTYEGVGPISGALPPGTFDFDDDPLNGTLGDGTIGTVIEEPIIPGEKANVTLIVPFSFDTTLIDDPTEITATISGTLVATGMKMIPEPASWVLICLGMTSIVPVVRRRLAARYSG